MMSFKRHVFLPLAALLAACSKEPGETQMLAALHDNPQFAIMLGMAVGMSGGRNADAQLAELKKNAVVEKSGCVQATGAPGYVCDIRWGQRQPNGSVQYGNPIKGRFFKAGDGWAFDPGGR